MVAVILALVLLIALCAVVGGLWALVKQQVVVDESGVVSEIEIPLVGKLKTNYPSLVAIMLGIGLAWAVQSRLELQVTVPTAPLLANLRMDGLPEDTYVIVGAVPQKYLKVQNVRSSDGIRIDVEEPGPYTVVAFTVTGISDNRPVYKVVSGPATANPETKTLEFTGNLGRANQTE